jgi:hypothetical protein
MPVNTLNLSPLKLAIQDEDGDLVDGATVTVRIEVTGALAPQCFARDGAPKGNPFVAADGGDLDCYLPGGRYRIDAVKAAFSRTWRDVQVGTMQSADFTAQWIPGPDWDAATTFAKYTFVQHNRANYVSRQDNNLNHAPPVDANGKPVSDAWWTFVPATGFVRFVFFIGGRPRPGIGQGELLLSIDFEERTVFPANLVGSRFKAKFPAQAETAWALKKNGAPWQTATWAAAGTTAAFAAVEVTVFEPGDRLDIYAPEARDDGLADIACWLAAFPY